MAAFASAPVAVRRGADAVIEIGDARPAGVLTESVGLHGATVVVDLTRPGAVPYAKIDDAGRALWWLQFVYGAAVADEVRRLSDPDEQRPATQPPVTQSPTTQTSTKHALTERPIAEPGFLAAPVLRFGVGLWLWRWWPSKDRAGVELTRAGERWLQIELGTLAWFAEDVFGGKSAATALLADQVQTVLEQASRDRGTVRPLAIVRAVVESVPVDDATYEALSVLEAAIADSARVAEATDWTNAPTPEFDLPGGPYIPRYAQLDEPPTIIASGVSTVEWGRVRPRLLGAAEANVPWSILELSSGRAAVEARVPVGDRWQDGEAVYAAVYRNGSHEPDELIAFQDRAHGSHHLVAYSEITPPQPGDTFRVSVFDEASAAEPPTPVVARTPEERAAVVEAVQQLLGPQPAELVDRAPYDLDPTAAWPVPDAT